MTEYSRCYSELVDEIATLTGRNDKLPEIKAFINDAVRGCVVRANFFKDLVEDSITPDGEDTYVYEPLPTNFRIIRSVLYPNLGTYPENKPPGRIQADQDSYYYVGSNYVTFKGCAQEDTIDWAYYSYPAILSYYADGARPAIFDNVAGSWSYLSGGSYVPTLGTTALNEAAQALVSNWVLFTWYNVVKYGALAKLYFILDDPRGPKNLALYKAGQDEILKGESFESMNA